MLQRNSIPFMVVWLSILALQNFFVNVKALGNELRASSSRCNDELPGGGLTHRYREAEQELIDLCVLVNDFGTLFSI